MVPSGTGQRLVVLVHRKPRNAVDQDGMEAACSAEGAPVACSVHIPSRRVPQVFLGILRLPGKTGSSFPSVPFTLQKNQELKSPSHRMLRCCTLWQASLAV